MKRNMRIILIVLLVSILFNTVSFAEPIKVNVNGNQLLLSANPVSKDGRTLVPLRAIFEALGASVEWDQATKTVTGTQGSKVVKLQIDNKVAKVNGVDVTMDVAGTIINGSTFVPVRFIAESLGAQVSWDGNTQTVLVNSNGTTQAIKTYKVIRVVDGDTIKVNFNGVEESVRLIGIDTPESVHPDAAKNVIEGKTASDYTKALIEGKEVTLEFDVEQRDRYGRLLAYVYLNGVMVNKTLLQEGYAQVSTYPPNVKYVDDFTSIQRVARENNKGLWAYEAPVITTPIVTAPVAPISPIANTGSGQYKGSIKSDKYHYANYTHSGQINNENLIWFDSIKDAEAHGYKPCGNCF